MNNKKLLISAIAVLFSVSAVHATNITGVAGNNGVYNINPEKVNGSVGFRHYDNFNLSEGDVANLIYTGVKNGQIRNVETFVNMVNSRINVNGLVNTVRDGAFYNGHAVFISPNGMVVGASGVLNVGALSVIAPTESKYNKMLDEYGNQQYSTISNLSALKQDGRNADITINGKVIAREGVTIDGSRVNVPGYILNGATKSEVLTSAQQAEALFNNLVNTQKITSANIAQANNGNIILRSGNTEESGIFVSGTIDNRSSGETALTNHGGAGMEVTGTVNGGNYNVTLYNTKGAMNVNGTVKSAKNAVSISNKSGADLNIGTKADISGKTVDIVNGEGAGHLAVAGKAAATGALNVVNRGEGGLLVTSSADLAGKTARVVNKAGELGLAANSSVKGTSKVEVVNYGKDLTVNGNVNATKGSVVLYNQNGKLKVSADANVVATKGLSVKNYGADGMTLEGKINNTGDTAVHNYAGDLTLNGELVANGNMTVKNHADAGRLFVTKNAKITHTGEVGKVFNEGKDGLVFNGTIDNDGNLYIYNDNGEMLIGANADENVVTKIANKNGTLFINSRKDSTGVTVSSQSVITNEGGNSLSIKHQGSGVNERGLNIQGTVTNDGQTAINNSKNDMYISGNITSGGDLGIVNKAGSNNMLIASDANINGGSVVNIRHAGTGDMTINGTINHDGRANVIADNGKLNVGGAINTNNGALTYIASRKDGKGINITSGFSANTNGDVLIKNISGSEGLRYEGAIVNNGGQTALVNKKGDMVVGGTIDNTGSKNMVIISHSGDKLTARGYIKNDGGVKVVNRSGKVIDKKDLKVDSVEFQYFGKY